MTGTARVRPTSSPRGDGGGDDHRDCDEPHSPPPAGLPGTGGRLYEIIDLENSSGVRLTREFYSQPMTDAAATTLKTTAIAALQVKKAASSRRSARRPHWRGT